MEEENECLYNSLVDNSIQLKSTSTNSKDENKEDTFIKKRKRTKDKNPKIKDEEKESNINDLVEKNKNSVNNNEISKNEKIEYKFNFEKYNNINNINSEYIIYRKEEKKDDGDDDRSMKSRNYNPFDIKFIDFLSPCDKFKKVTINNNDDNFNNLSTLDNNQFNSYNENKIDYIEDKHMNFF